MQLLRFKVSVIQLNVDGVLCSVKYLSKESSKRISLSFYYRIEVVLVSTRLLDCGSKLSYVLLGLL